MPWQGGTYVRSNGVYQGSSVWNSDESNGVDIVSDRHDTHDFDLANGINACLNKNGQNTMAGDLAMGGNKVTGMANATDPTDAVAYSQLPVDGTTNGYLMRWNATTVKWEEAGNVQVNDAGVPWFGDATNGLSVYDYLGITVLNATEASDPTTTTNGLAFQGLSLTFTASGTAADMVFNAVDGSIRLQNNGDNGLVQNTEGRVFINSSGGTQRLRVQCDTGDTNALYVASIAGDNTLLLSEDGSDLRLPELASGGGTYPLMWDALGRVRYDTSSARYKENITDYNVGLDKAMLLQPHSYNYIDSGEADTGFIAEELAEAGLSEFVIFNENGQADAIKYSRMVALLFNCVKELKAEIDDLKAR